MVVISLDAVVKNILLKRGYSVHWYLQLLVYCKDAMREIGFDDPIFATRYKCLPLNSNHAIEIPNDYLDKVRVSVRNGQYIVPLVEDNSLQLVPNYDSSFDIQPYSEGVAEPSTISSGQEFFTGYNNPYWWSVNWNSWGENTGRMFGGVGGYIDTFKVNKARNEIKINESLCVEEVILEYISNGMDADSATHIDAYAQFAIEKFALWQMKEHSRTYSAGEAQVAKQDYEHERQVLRARLNPMTIDTWKRIIDQNRSRIKY